MEAIKALDKNVKASNFFNVFKKTPQKLENVNFEENDILQKLPVKKAIKIAKKMIKGHGRILVRKSGTEPKIRIMGESQNLALLDKCIKIIKKTIN